MAKLRPARGKTVLALLLCLACARPAHANLLVNGSFETGPAPGDALALAPGSTAIGGWTVTRAGIDYVGTRWTAASGARSVALNGPDAGGVAQTFATLPHALYSVRFYLAGDADSQPLLKTARVGAAGQSGDFTADITGMWAWDPGWNPHMWSFQATSTSTTIEFFSTMAGLATGPTLDSVSVELVSTAGVGDGAAPAFALAPVAPNPVRDGAALRFALPAAGAARLAVYDLAGREVAVLADGAFGAGEHAARWDGRSAGAAAPAGLYFVELRGFGRRLVRSLVLVR